VNVRPPALALPLILASSSALASPGSPYRLELGFDLPLLGLGAAGTTIAFVELPPAACLPDCRPPASLNGLDRTVLGNYSPTSHTIADYTVLTLALAPVLLDLVDSRGDGWLEDATVHVEALLLTQAVTQLTKVAVRRTAPFVYDASVPLEERMNRDSTRSFISGHTAMAFAAATSYAITYWLRHPDDPWRWLVLIGAEALALGVGLLKIHAGYHYWTDIGAGALVGASIGAVVPLAHAW
jgi:membrane-associated phospholipid phosphatase